MIAVLAVLALGQASKLPAQLVTAHLKDTSGIEVSIPEKDSKATVLLFVACDCPIANRMAPEISRIATDFAPKGVKVHLVYAEPSTTTSDVEKHLKDYHLPPSAFLDKDHALKKATGATVTPQAIVLNSLGKVVYRGRINDVYQEHGKVNTKATKNDLRDALGDVLAGRPVKVPITEAIGCFITD